jgi:hypothetical protein
MSARPFRFMKKANIQWEQEMMYAPLVYVGVVQANQVLFSSDTSRYAPAVITYTADPRYALDGGFVQRLASRIYEAKNHMSPDPEVNQLGALLRDEDSNFSRLVPTALSDGVKAHVKVTYLDPDTLPGRAIPGHRLLPAIVAPDNITYLLPKFYL